MKILIDMQGYQSLSRDRGIGRYTKEFILEFIKQSTDDIYLLFNDTMAYDKELFCAKQIILHTTKNKQVNELLREKLILDINPDIILITSLFEGFADKSIVTINKYSNIPTAVIVYDLIPYIYKDKFLVGDYKKFYLEKIEYLKKANHFLSISESSKQELIQYLNIPEDKITNISSATNIDPSNITDFEELSKNLSITKPYILHIGAYEERKNFNRLINAFNMLDLDYQLVLVTKKHQNTDKIIYTGFLDDTKLNTLYKNAKLVVFPSLHEGFGLPILESFAFSTPAITSNISSMPEVVGEKGITFDPYNEKEIAQAIQTALQNYDEQIQVAQEQYQKFSWEKTAKTALKTLQNFKTDSQIDIFQNTNKLISEIAKLKKFTELELIEIANQIDKNEQEALNTNLKIRIEGPFDSTYSLALLNRETALALEQLGFDVALHSTEGGGDFPPNKQFLKQNPNIEKLYKKSFTLTPKIADLTSRNLYPPRVSDMSSKINTLHHYAWEESGFPHEWIENFNNHLTYITTLSTHVKKVLIDNGLKIPIRVSGCGVNHWLPIKPSNYQLPKTKKFKILHVSSCFPRKGVDVLLKAYNQAFTKNDNVSLIIKTFDNPHNTIDSQIKELFTENSPEVIVIKDDLSNEDLKALYEQCDILVNPSRAEGFGLPLAEAMLSGLGVVTTNWSGQLDFCNDKNSFLIDYTFKQADTHFKLFDSVWAEPDTNHLTKILKSLYQNPSQIKQKVENAQKTLQNFTWLNTAKRMLPITSKQKKPKIGWVSTWQTKCGLATYSEHLLKFFDDVTIFAPYDSPDKKAIRCWELNENIQNLDNLIQEIIQNNIDVLVIQFNYGLYSFEQLTKLINTINIPIIITLHSTQDPNQPNKALKNLYPALKQCSRILVHSIADLNRLKQINLVDNVTLFPHGVLDTDLTKPITDEITIATFGFFLPHKGLIETIDAFKILKQKYPKLKLKMLNSEYPIDLSTNLIKEAKNHLTDDIELITDFLEDEEILTQLNEADIILFPYQNTNESASGAVRYAVALDKEILITPISIFDDIKEFCFTAKNATPQKISEGLDNLIQAIKNNSDELKEKQKLRKKYLETHKYSKISRRLYNICYNFSQIL